MKLDRSYRRLPAARAAMRMVQSIYAVTHHFPSWEKSGLTAVLRRSAVAIPPKIASIYALNTSDEAAKALHSAMDAVREVDGLLDVALKLRMAKRWRFRYSRKQVDRLVRCFGKMLDEAQFCDDDENEPNAPPAQELLSKAA